MKSKTIISGIATLLCLAATVFLWFAVNNENPEYEEVKATVISSQSGYRKIAGSRQAYYKVKVEYAGKEYELQNVYSSAPYRSGNEVTVYSANGSLYANTAGVKTATPLATVYFIFLFGTFIMFGIWVTFLSKNHKKNKPAD